MMRKKLIKKYEYHQLSRINEFLSEYAAVRIFFLKNL
jgi:hypothetical protein